jgi:hypothetical protein
MNDWQPESTRGSVAQYLAPTLVFIIAIALYLVAVI